MDLQNLNNKNNFKIKSCFDKEFLTFGRIINDYDFSEMHTYLEEKTIVPTEKNIYVASDKELENTKIAKEIKFNLYGNMPIQIGYCNGNNDRLGCLEYHKCSEVNYAVTDIVLMLAHTYDIEENSIPTDKVSVFFIPEKTAIEIYQTTLHFAPCKVSDEGFKCVVILARDTNLELENFERNNDLESKLLFMKNKWLLAHKDREDIILRGAVEGILGENLKLNY